MLLMKRKPFRYRQSSDRLQVQLPHQPYSFVEVGMDLAEEHHGHYSLILFLEAVVGFSSISLDFFDTGTSSLYKKHNIIIHV